MQRNAIAPSSIARLSKHHLTLPHLQRHSPTCRHDITEAVLLIQLIGLAIRNQTHICRLGQILMHMFTDGPDNELAQSLFLVLRNDSNVHDFEEAAPVADEATHAHDLLRVVVDYGDGKLGPAQAEGRRFKGFGGEAGDEANETVSLDGWGFEAHGVASRGGHLYSQG
jgi:hypothetical protein